MQRMAELLDESLLKKLDPHIIQQRKNFRWINDPNIKKYQYDLGVKEELPAYTKRHKPSMKKKLRKLATFTLKNPTQTS